MPVRHASVAHPRGPRHARRLTSHSGLRAVSLALTTVLLLGVSAFAALGARLGSNITTVDVSRLVGGPAAPQSTAGASTVPVDPSADRAVNILVLGSDQRDAADNAAEGATTGGMRADTTIVVHLSADRTRAELVSIPRDSLVKIPACLMSNGKTVRAQGTAMINSAFATGWDNGGDMASAAACAIRTVQGNTGLTIDHFVVVNFTGFQAMVTAIGGVNICIPKALHDPYTGLNLGAGQQTLNGQQALQFARARHGNIGNGSDIDRIGNQQRLIAALANQVLSRGVLTNVTKLVPFLSAATSSLTTDLNLSTLSGLAYSLRNIPASGITFLTIPWGPAPSDPNRVVWTSAAKTVWANMVADHPINGSASATPSAPAASSNASASAPATTGAAPTSAATTPAPSQTKIAGQQAFTPADVTAVCQ